MRMGPKTGFASLAERIEWPLAIVVVLLAALGLLNLRNASLNLPASFHLTQALWYLIGTGVVAVVTVIRTRFFQRWAYVGYGAVILLLIAVAIFGTVLNGSKRWLSFGSFLMQPSELLKIAVIVVTARYFNDRNKEGSYALRELVAPTAVVLAGVFWVFNQPDLGTSLVILAIYGAMVLFEGVRWQSLMALAIAGIIALPLGYTFGLKEYQRDRISSFMNLDADTHGQSWQVRQSMIAFGSGRLWGKGHEEGTQVQKGFVPEQENDFIAANWGEERGFMGMLLLLGLYFAFIAAALNVSRKARDRYGVLVGVGVAALFFWHTVVNLGMVTGMLPVVGLTLPMLSYGGSSLLTMLAAVGLLFNVSFHRPSYG
ncbi:rod shape-determining protein RodA [Lujinxingia litoralis]|uniref:Rod shape-determining protein RodA n=1 Tax=Lujinxingia litoralis TaxID=2211119 RepID=A0A328C6E2_9DELT|nr:rod shape-determining protein RodA [Lujinxingia litoralis]RAL23505.1 rod shape-determining protein RodA [Lujinxingia litoralis]